MLYTPRSRIICSDHFLIATQQKNQSEVAEEYRKGIEKELQDTCKEVLVRHHMLCLKGLIITVAITGPSH